MQELIGVVKGVENLELGHKFILAPLNEKAVPFFYGRAGADTFERALRVAKRAARRLRLTIAICQKVPRKKRYRICCEVRHKP